MSQVHPAQPWPRCLRAVCLHAYTRTTRVHARAGCKTCLGRTTFGVHCMVCPCRTSTYRYCAACSGTRPRSASCTFSDHSRCCGLKKNKDHHIDLCATVRACTLLAMPNELPAFLSDKNDPSGTRAWLEKLWALRYIPPMQ